MEANPNDIHMGMRGIKNEDLQAAFRYSMQGGIEQVYQIEESELTSERIGSGSNRAILSGMPGDN